MVGFGWVCLLVSLLTGCWRFLLAGLWRAVCVFWWWLHGLDCWWAWWARFGGVAVLFMFPYTLGMHTLKKLTRKQIEEGLDSVPLAGLLGGSSKELTAKQKRFARDVALGKTKADAYRDNYNVTSAKTMIAAPYLLAADNRVKLEIEAIKRAQAAEHLKNPLALRSLVIQTLVEVASNPDAKHSDRLAAVKILGGVTEVAAFTERKETKVITSSTDARAQILAELRSLANAHASDAKVIDAQASELLDELKSAQPEPHPTPIPQSVQEESRGLLHTIPLEQFPENSKNSNNQNINSTPQTPPHPFREDPPV